MIKSINTYRIWEITKIFQEKENDVFSNFYEAYDSFLNTYSFKYDIDTDSVLYYYDDSVPYEDWRNQETNYLPMSIYNGTDDDVREYAKLKLREHEESIKIDREREIRSLEFRLKHLKDENNLF